MAGFRILREGNEGSNGFAILDFMRADCGLIKPQLGRIHWVMVLGEKRGLGRLVEFQGSPPPSSKVIHPDVHGCLSLTKLKHRKEVCKRWKQAQLTQEENGESEQGWG